MIVASVGERDLWLFRMFIVISCFKLVFLQKAIIGCKLLNIFLKLLLMLNMYQLLFIISSIVGSSGLYVNENGIESSRLGLKCFQIKDLSRWSTPSISFRTVEL